MPTTPDTTSTTINGKDGTADVSIGSQSYKCIIDQFTVREAVEMTNADTFCTEGSADQEPGRSQLFADLAGLLKKGGPASGPLIPAPQNVAMVLTASTACTISGNWNFTEATVTRTVNQNGRIIARAMSKGTYIVTWSKTSS